jgi:hypothetical protein
MDSLAVENNMMLKEQQRYRRANNPHCKSAAGKRLGSWSNALFILI